MSRRRDKKEMIEPGDDPLASAIRGVLSPDLADPDSRREGDPPHRGCCYPASEAYWEWMGRDSSGWTMMQAGSRAAGDSHWWLEDPDGRVLDLEADRTGLRRLRGRYPYESGRRASFQKTYEGPSARAAEIIRRVKAGQKRKPRKLPPCALADPESPDR